MADDDLFDYMYFKRQDLEDENEELKSENDYLRGELEDNDNRRTIISSSKVDDYDRARFFAEDVQSIAADCWLDMEISYEEADRAIKAWYTPEDYYEYKASTLI